MGGRVIEGCMRTGWKGGVGRGVMRGARQRGRGRSTGQRGCGRGTARIHCEVPRQIERAKTAGP